MDFDDTPDEAEFRRTARAWLDANAPQDFDVAKYDHNIEMEPYRDWQNKKAQDGWACITWPNEFGGRGREKTYQVIWSQEEGDLAHLSTPFIIGLGMVGATLMTHGSEELQQQCIGPIIRGEEIWCQLFSEPAAGSDLAAIRTSAVKDGDDWIINGQKIWTSFAQIADYGILLARTDPDVPKHRGLTYFIIDMKAPGIEVRPLRMVSGESDFNEVFLDDVRIPDSHRVGEVGEGWKVALTTLMNERLSVGSALQTSFDDIMELAKSLGNDARPLIEHADVREKVADWFVNSNGLKYLNFRMNSALSRGETPGPETAIAKLVLGRGRQALASLALDMQDATGILTEEGETPLDAKFQRLFLHTIGHRIAGGTDEIILNIIGERVLGLPRDSQGDREVPFSELRVT